VVLVLLLKLRVERVCLRLEVDDFIFELLFTFALVELLMSKLEGTFLSLRKLECLQAALVIALLLPWLCHVTVHVDVAVVVLPLGYLLRVRLLCKLHNLVSCYTLFRSYCFL